MGSSDPFDVYLVQMPYAPCEVPSLALGILKASLADTGISCKVVHANLLFMKEVGTDLYHLPRYDSRSNLNGEWTFTGRAFPDAVPDHTPYLARAAEYFACANYESEAERREAGVALEDAYRHLHGRASEFVDRLAARICELSPRVVGCTSTFEQHVPSLALLRRLKEWAPEILTVIGGANAEGQMGLANLQAFPWLDVVFSGEADEAFPSLCRGLLQHGADIPLDELPDGALTRKWMQERADEAEVPRASVRDMEAVPVPDYDDYFETFRRCGLEAALIPALTVEMSRGCWWGARRHCTFCGLNGEGMAFRSKSAERTLSELDTLSERYGTRRFMATDNILDMKYLRDVLPQMASSGRDYRMFIEIKANLRREQVQVLADAGVYWVQPGIEALHDDLLALMGKGSTAMINLQLLKYTREVGIFPAWNLLAGFPGEDDSWHEEAARLLHLVFHFAPPNKVFRIRFDRFSPYFSDAERFGLELAPFDAYQSLYPLPAELVTDLAYFFRDARTPHISYENVLSLDQSEQTPGLTSLRRGIGEWRDAWKRYGTTPPMLSFRSEGDALIFTDTRPCALQEQFVVRGLPRLLYEQCDPAIDERGLIRRVQSLTQGAYSPAQVVDALHGLVADQLVLEAHGRYLSLALPEGVPQLRPREESATGFIPLPRIREIVKAFRRRKPVSTVGWSLDAISSSDFHEPSP